MSPKNPKVTRSSASRRQQQETDSLASGSSPPKFKRTKKSTEEQPSLESPEVTGITPQVVTVTKQGKSSEESSSDSNSIDESALQVTQVKMTSSFDPKLEHLLTNYFMAIGDQHDIQQAFIQNSITTFDLFTGMCTFQFLRNMQL